MTAAEIHAEVVRLRAQAAPLINQRDQRQGTLNDALAADPGRYSDQDVRDARDALAATERRLAEIYSRVSALLQQLPDASQMKAAEARAQALVERIQDEQSRTRQLWPRYFASLQQAEAVGREFAQSRAHAAEAIAQLKDLTRQFGVAAPIPDGVDPPAVEFKLAGHIAQLLQEVAFGGTPSSTVDAYVTDARAQLRRAAGEAAGLASR